jgi:hypothetical protein
VGWLRRECGTGGTRAVFFWLSHVFSVGYLKADENCSYFFRRPSLSDESCCSFVGF